MATDFYDIDALLTEDERMVRDNVRAFVDAGLPGISKHYEDGTFPTELIPEFGELGVLGANLPGYGCAGMGDIAYGLVMQELERGDSGIRSFCSVQGALVMYPDLRLRHRGAERHLAPEAGERRGRRLLRPHGARLRLQPRRDDHPRRAHRQRLRAQRHQALDHQRQPRRRRHRVGEARRGHPRLRRRHEDPRASPRRRSSGSSRSARR
jgi:hypothetical protein